MDIKNLKDKDDGSKPMQVSNTPYKSTRIQINWLAVYTNTVSVIGGVIAIIALMNLPQDLVGLAAFALLVTLAELGNVELFHSSRGSSVSVSMVVTMAAILSLGAMAGVLIEVISAIVNSIKSYIIKRKSTNKNTTTWFRVTTFNIGMFVISTACAGWVFSVTGGQTGNLLHWVNLAPFGLAVITSTFVNIFLLMVVISMQNGIPLIVLWKNDFQWSVPITLAGLVVAGSSLAVAYQSFGLLGTAVFALPVLAIGYSFRIYANNMRGYVDSLENLNVELHDTNIGLLETLSAVIDAYDIFTYGHSAQVADYAGTIAQKLGLSEQEQQKIIKAALIHDIGKIGVPETIICKTGRLSDNEFAIIRRHPTIGAEILGRLKGLQELVPLVLHHQEKFDGSGYPDGLSGEQIPLGARILTLADSLDAMYSDRTYKHARQMESVVAEVQRCSGSHFDPQLVKVFLQLVEEQGKDFFHNSAQTVDREVALSNFRVQPDGAKRFLKKSQME